MIEASAPLERVIAPDVAGSRGDIDGALAGASFVALVTISLLPIVLVRYPESVDYLNHLGRAFVLTAPEEHPVHAFFRPEWHLMPNLGLDFLVLGLFKFMPLEAAMKAAWVITAISLPGAFWFLYRTVHGRNAPGLLLSALCLFNLPLTVGFLSFSLGLAAALAATGLWFRLGGKATLRNLIILNAASSAIAIMHAAALGALGLTIVALHAFRAPWRPLAIIGRAATAACGFLAPLLLLALCMEPGASGLRFNFPEKPLLLFSPVFSGIPLADAIGDAALIAVLYIVLRLGQGRCDRRLLPTLAVWAIVIVLLPSEAGRAVATDRRLAVLPILLLLVSLHGAPRRLEWLASGVAAAAVLARLAIMIPEWQGYNLAIDGFRSLEKTVEPGAKILIAEAPQAPGKCNERWRWPLAYHHIPVLLLMERDAFIPTLFSAPGMQPIRPTEKYRPILDPDAGILSWRTLLLADTAAGRSQVRADIASGPWRPYFFGWRDAYDYLLLLSLNCSAGIPPDRRLQFLGQGGGYRLYKIVHTQ